ncbi:TIGR01777 family oxidoreductase [Fictibacillus fluitans]|uniref:TIGR01777 family oxidoreductase n=1 Tax=Fictibacillus fluitans TaxID=3058422 RepID=A0ABT8HYI5_9BACL|nr:TIGR01777 family oxidoreductase [Fictibacillus sp. NE201]MDN4525801.1 TIGR01777 family oxidoreductase [Fictibacillus sp. NE201]
MSKKIVLAGGSGFLGENLAEFLQTRNYDIVILSRQPYKVEKGIRYIQWDGRSMDEWASELDGSHAVVNFTGKSVNCIYTKKNREEIVSSRIDSVRVLKEAIQSCTRPPQAFIQAGSLAIFGDTALLCDEDSPHGSGFSVEVCQRWEEEFFKEEIPGTRQVLFRIGFALGRNGGALEPLQKLASLNLGGTVGSGKQYISWLHVDDLNAMFLYAIESERFSGIYNATGPQPVTNKEFMKTLRGVMGKGWAPPAPSPFVRLGAYAVMRTEPSLALTGRNCIPARLVEQGFQFAFTSLEEALHDILQPVLQ